MANRSTVDPTGSADATATYGGAFMPAWQPSYGPGSSTQMLQTEAAKRGAWLAAVDMQMASLKEAQREFDLQLRARETELEEKLGFERERLEVEKTLREESLRIQEEQGVEALRIQEELGLEQIRLREEELELAEEKQEWEMEAWEKQFEESKRQFEEKLEFEESGREYEQDMLDQLLGKGKPGALPAEAPSGGGGYYGSLEMGGGSSGSKYPEGGVTWWDYLGREIPTPSYEEWYGEEEEPSGGPYAPY